MRIREETWSLVLTTMLTCALIGMTVGVGYTAHALWFDPLAPERTIPLVVPHHVEIHPKWAVTTNTRGGSEAFAIHISVEDLIAHANAAGATALVTYASVENGKSSLAIDYWLPNAKIAGTFFRAHDTIDTYPEWHTAIGSMVLRENAIHITPRRAAWIGLFPPVFVVFLVFSIMSTRAAWRAFVCYRQSAPPEAMRFIRPQ
ncbi:hypothetical protein HYV74_03175 [Candidatus Uhrbacteria bacterium]|nr:hypothetical protein [Candidatus Uhrbacteria bacterium]